MERGRLWLKKENCLFGCVFCCRRFWRWHCFGAEASAQMPCWIATADPRPRKSFCRPAKKSALPISFYLRKEPIKSSTIILSPFWTARSPLIFCPLTISTDCGDWSSICPAICKSKRSGFPITLSVFLFPPIPRRLCFPFWNIYKTVNNIRLFFSILIPSPPLLLPVNSVVIFNLSRKNRLFPAGRGGFLHFVILLQMILYFHIFHKSFNDLKIRRNTFPHKIRLKTKNLWFFP